MHGVIIQLKLLGKVRTSETYAAALRSFMAFREDVDVPIDGIRSDLMLLYEAWLKARGIRTNTISFYMRILRAVYNHVVERGLYTAQSLPSCLYGSGQDRQADYSHQSPEGTGLVIETVAGLCP